MPSSTRKGGRGDDVIDGLKDSQERLPVKASPRNVLCRDCFCILPALDISVPGRSCLRILPSIYLSIPLSVSQANKKPSCREKIAAVDDDDQTWGAINFLIYSTFAVLIAMVMLGVP